MSWHREQVRKPGVTTQVLLADALRERDEARAQLAEAQEGGEKLLIEAAAEKAQAVRFREEKYQIADTLRRVQCERDEARAIARRLAEATTDQARIAALATFVALPWAKDADA